MKKIIEPKKTIHDYRKEEKMQNTITGIMVIFILGFLTILVITQLW